MLSELLILGGVQAGEYLLEGPMEVREGEELLYLEAVQEPAVLPC